MKTKTCLLGLLFLLLPKIIEAQVCFDGEIRPRAEFRQGYKKPLADSLAPAFVILQRTRFSADYKSKILNARITIQDARIWGKSNTKSSDSKLEIYEAWAEYLIQSGFSARFGRQILKYDDQRLLGAASWSNTGIAHDILLLKLQPSDNLQVHTGFAYNNSTDTLMKVVYTTSKMYKAMGFIWFSKTFSNNLNITIIGIEEGLQKSNDYEIMYSRFTGGGNITYKNDSSKLTFNALGYYQKGKSSTFDDLNAYIAAAKLGYKFYKENTVFIGADYYSGTKSDAKSGTSATFNKLYGANHVYNGDMDYWISIPKSGLVNYFGGIQGKITSKLSTDITFNLFNIAQDMIVGQRVLGKNLGHELDLVLNYRISKEIALQAGYCRYFNSNSTADYFKVSEVGLHQSQWAYLMLTITPKFYETPKIEEKK